MLPAVGDNFRSPLVTGVEGCQADISSTQYQVEVKQKVLADAF